MILAGVMSAPGHLAVYRRTWRARGWRALTQSGPGARISRWTLPSGLLRSSLRSGRRSGGVSPMLPPHPCGGPPLAGYEVLAIGGLVRWGSGRRDYPWFGRNIGTVLCSSAYRDAIGFVLMALFLIFRPQGLFGQKV
jgi:hypothetical protein